VRKARSAHWDFCNGESRRHCRAAWIRALQISTEARFSWQRTTEETETKGRGAARSGRL